MRIRVEFIVSFVFLTFLTVGTVAIKFLLDLFWFQAIELVTNIVLTTSGGVDTSGMNLVQKLVIFAIAVTGAAIQLGVIVFFVSLLIRYLVKRQEDIEQRIQYILAEYPVRRLFTIIFLSILFFSIVVIKTIEAISWLDAIYFTIITISTVGFGDITVNHPISKLVTILLIFNGITFIGLASQIIIHRIVNLQLSKQNSLPSEPLPMENHVIIAGYGSKGRRLAQLFLERGYEVVVVERDEERAKLAEVNGYKTINGDITKPALLEILSLNESAGLFLLLTDDNLVIQAGIIARSIADDLDIYGEFLSAPTYNIARYAGINKPISLSVFLTNELQGFFNTQELNLIQSLRDLRTQESTLGFIQVPFEYEYQGLFENPLTIGEISTGFNEIYLDSHLSLDYEKPPVSTSHLLLAVDREELDQKLKSDSNRSFRQIDRLIFAGYSELIDSLIERLDFPEENIIVLWHNQENQETLKTKPYKKYQWNLENGHLLLEQLVKDGDMVICTFEDITSSLIIGVTLNNLKRDKTKKNPLENVNLIQFVPYEYDIEPLMKVGAEIVYTPQQIISSAILSIFLKENNLSPSVVYTNGHLYEHLVIPEDKFHGKMISELSTERYNVLYIRKEETDTFERLEGAYQLQAGDRILMFIKNQQKERMDRLVPRR